MDDLVNEVVKMGLLGAKGQSDEMSRFLAMVQRFAEAVSQDQETARVCRHFVRIIIEETTFENCSILFWNEHAGSLALVAAYGLEDQLEVLPAAAIIRICALNRINLSRAGFLTPEKLFSLKTPPIFQSLKCRTRL